MLLRVSVIALGNDVRSYAKNSTGDDMMDFWKIAPAIQNIETRTCRKAYRFWERQSARLRQLLENSDTIMKSALPDTVLKGHHEDVQIGRLGDVDDVELHLRYVRSSMMRPLERLMNGKIENNAILVVEKTASDFGGKMFTIPLKPLPKSVKTSDLRQKLNRRKLLQRQLYHNTTNVEMSPQLVFHNFKGDPWVILDDELQLVSQ